MTPSGIELATFRLVAHCLDQLPHRVPPKSKSGKKYLLLFINYYVFDFFLNFYCLIQVPFSTVGGGGGGMCQELLLLQF